MPGQTIKSATYEKGQESSKEAQDVPGHPVDDPGGNTANVKPAESSNEQTAPQDCADATVEPSNTTGTRIESEDIDYAPDKAQCEVDDPGGDANGRDDDKASIEGERTGMLVRGRSTTTADENNQRSITDVNDVPDKSPEPPWPPDKPETRRETLIEGERKSVTTQGQLTTADEANDQHNLSGVEDVPEGLPMPPKPPDEPADRASAPQSIKLEGERSGYPSFEPGSTGPEAD
ncbi:hypothetical protein EV363DRAFT_1133998, partial [Boletus edulis]